MSKFIMVGDDLHEDSMLLKIAADRGPAEKQSFGNTPSGRRALIGYLRGRSAGAGGAWVVIAYEASGLGFNFRDEMTAAGFTCHVLAPTRIARSPRHRRQKCDEKDADRLLELLRGHLLAGNELPTVWVPDAQTRDDREVVRARMDLTGKATAVKTQIRTLLKRNGIEKPSGLERGWGARFRAWLQGLAGPRGRLRGGARCALGTLLRQLGALEEELGRLDRHIEKLAAQPRHAAAVRALDAVPGVGLLLAVGFVTEMGALNRFGNRKQVGAFLGLVPASHESGDGDDRKGHITHQGSWRLRRLLCQGAWARVRHDPGEGAVYARLVERNPKHKKIAVVACMRRLAVLLWHLGRNAQGQAPPREKHPLAA